MCSPTPSPAAGSAAPFAEAERFRSSYIDAGSQLRDYIYERSRQLFAHGEAQRDALQTREQVKQHQNGLRSFLRQCLAGPASPNTPLNPRVTGTAQGAGFKIEKVIFESRPHHYVTGHLYLPAGGEGPTAAVLFLCGHYAEAKTHIEYQSVCQFLVQAGLIVFAQDPIGQGERLSYYDPTLGQPVIPAGTAEHDYAGAQCRFVGDHLAHYFLDDARRSIDYLMTRPEVDSARIGVTGNSGGGVQVSLLMMSDPRIAAAAPCTFITTRADYQRTGMAQDAEQIWSGFTGAGYDHEDILLAIAPKPVCVLAVTSDFFPIEGTRHAVGRARRIWDLFNQSDALELVEDEGTHAYTPRLARAAARFFAKHLLNREIDPSRLQAEPFSTEHLLCTKSGQVRGDFPDAEFVHEANLARCQEAEGARARQPAHERKSQALEWLRNRVFKDRTPCDLNPRHVARSVKAGDLAVDVAFWWPQPNLANLGMLIYPRQRPARLPVTLALWDDGTQALSRHASFLQTECRRGRGVFVLNLCGMGPLEPQPVNALPKNDFYGTFHKFCDDLDWIGDSLIALRTYEVVRAIDVLTGWPGLRLDDLEVYAHGRIGIHARLAAALDPRIKRQDWVDGFNFSEIVGPRNYESLNVKSFILPGVLQHFEISDL